MVADTVDSDARKLSATRETTMHTNHAPTIRRLGRGSAVLAALVLLLALIVPGIASAGGDVRGADVLTQDEQSVYARNGARLTRTDYSFTVTWKIRTPQSGSYLYPTADLIPPGAPPHPEIVPGHPEVFTLWAFVFNHPDQCTDACDFDDIGADMPAQGGVHQLDGTVADSRTIRMRGKVRIGQPPAAGAALGNPTGAEVHVAMAPHGRAYSGADLARQLNGAVGQPPHWWVAIFETQ